MKLVKFKQRSQQWMKWRTQGVTSSDAAIVIGESPFKTKWRLWAEKLGVVREKNLDGNPHVQQGIAFEDAARRQFEERHDEILLPVCAESDEHPILRASFDGLSEDGCPVEIKCPSDKNFAEVLSKGQESMAFRLCLPQVQHQLYVSGADRGWLVFYWNGRLEEIQVQRDQAMIDKIVEASLRFWEMVEQGREPPLDPDRDLFTPREISTAWVQKAAQYLDVIGEMETVHRRLNELERSKKNLESWFVEQMGDFTQCEYAGIRVKRWLQRGTIDYKEALRSLAPEVSEEDLERFRRAASERFRVDLV